MRTTEEEVAPVCKDCSFRWNFHGYEVLKRIDPQRLMKSLLWLKLIRLFRQPSAWTVYKDVRALTSWAAYSARLERKAKQARQAVKDAERVVGERAFGIKCCNAFEVVWVKDGVRHFEVVRYGKNPDETRRDMVAEVLRNGGQVVRALPVFVPSGQ